MKRPLFKVLRINSTKLMILAGFFYSSWPLGYWLNPKAAQGLASELGSLHQPYNWVFNSMDIVCGILVGIASGELLMVIRNGSNRKNLPALWIAVLGVGGFGLFTAIGALLPLNCIQESPQCLVSLHNSYFLIHGIFSIGSIAGLTISIVAIWLVLVLREQDVIYLVRLSPTIFLFVWLSFGALTLFLILNHRSSALAQHFFIGFCCLWLVALPYLVRLIVRLQ